MSSSLSVSRRSFFSSAAALGATAILPLPAFAQSKPAAPARGGVLAILLNWEPTSLVGIATTSGAEQTVGPKINEGLLSYDLKNVPVPELATAWEISKDGLTYIFALRKGVKWQDGKDFQSGDVKLSLEILKKHHPRGRSAFANITGIETPDAHTVVLRLSAPAPYLLYSLSASESPIVAQHLYEGKDPLTNPVNLSPVGTGPYLYKEWQRGSHIRLARNPAYWDKDKPYLDELVVRFIPDQAARTIAFENGEVDLGGDSPIPFADVDRLKKDARFEVTTEGYSASPEQVIIEFNLRRAPLQDVRVRRAIAHALDRQTIIDLAWNGYGEVAPAAISPRLSQYYNGNIETYPYSLEKAKALLDQTDLPKTGERLKLVFDYPTSTAQFRDMGAYVRQQLAKIGIDVQLRAQDLPTFTTRIYKDRDFDLSLVSLGNSFDPTLGVQRTYWGKNVDTGVPFANASGYRNARVDQLLEAAAVEADPAARVRQFHEFQQIVAQDLPNINLLTRGRVTIANSKVRNHTTGAYGPRSALADVFIAQA